PRRACSFALLLDTVPRKVVACRHRPDVVRLSGGGWMLLIQLERPFPRALVDHATGRRGRLCGVGLPAVLPLLLLSSLVVIVPLAYAGPPDPTWIPGIYDNADYDDVVGSVTDGSAASAGRPPARVADG